ncbi:PrgI family protein [Actinosynnema sp. CA-299493]
MHDRVLGPLTARQLAVLATTGTVLYLIWAATRTFVPIAVFAAFVVPLGAAATMLAVGKRDGMPLDTLLLAAIRQRLAPRHRVAAPEGVRPAPAWLTPTANRTTDGKGRVERPEQVSPSALRLPAEAVTETGVVDLGGDGLAVVAVASTVNFALRTPNEQEALVASFGRYLHSLTAPVQVVVRTERLDLTAELRERAGGLPHPALEAAAVEHADYLAQLGEQSDLLREPIDGAAPTDGLGGPGPLAVLGAMAGKRLRRYRFPPAMKLKNGSDRTTRRRRTSGIVGDMRARSVSTSPSQCVHRLAGKRVWDTKGSPYSMPACLYTDRWGWCPNRIPNLIPNVIPHVNPRRPSPYAQSISMRATRRDDQLSAPDAGGSRGVCTLGHARSERPDAAASRRSRRPRATAARPQPRKRP